MSEADRVQLEILRRFAPERRARMARSMSRLVMQLARAEIRRADPSLDDRELTARFVARCYGDELAARVREALARRKP